MNRGICPICIVEEDWTHILKCEGTNVWRDDVSKKRFSNICVEIGTRGIVGCTKKG
jgi:hypothetical protein